MVLSFWELPEDEQPPEDIWLDDTALKEWFDAVKARRKEKYGLKDQDRDEEPELVQNEATRGLRERLRARR